MTPEDLETFYADARRALASGDEPTLARRIETIADAAGMEGAELRAELRAELTASAGDEEASTDLLDDLHARVSLLSFDPFAIELPNIPARDDEGEAPQARVDPAAVNLSSLFS